MSSLYGREAKPFEHNDATVSETSMFFKTKSKRPKRDFDDLSFDSDDEESSKHLKEQKRAIDNDVEIVEIDTERKDDFQMQVQARVKALIQNSGAREDDEVIIIDDTPGKDTKHSRAAKALRKKIDNAGKGPTPKKGKKGAAAAAATSIHLDSPDVVELDGPLSTVRLPQRSVVATHVIDISLDRMQKLAGASASQVASSSGAISRAEVEKPQCKLKTRLNGHHERKWRICFDEPFGKLRSRFAVVYGIQLSDVIFKFDGDKIKDTETPLSLDMEDDNMIDATIDKALYARAVEAVERNAAAPVSERPGIRLRTRLNGSHEWKWKVVFDDTFDKVRQKFAEVYGLPVSAVRFEFDGDLVEDKHTPKALDMENDMMIDVKVDKTLFEKAVSCANAKKGT